MWGVQTLVVTLNGNDVFCWILSPSCEVAWEVLASVDWGEGGCLLPCDTHAGVVSFFSRLSCRGVRRDPTRKYSSSILVFYTSSPVGDLLFTININTVAGNYGYTRSKNQNASLFSY